MAFCNKVHYNSSEKPQLLLLVMNSLPLSLKGQTKSRFLTYLNRCLLQLKVST